MSLQHPDFIMWMVLFPVCWSICSVLDRINATKIYDEATQFWTAIFMMIMWLGMGIQLY